MGLRLTYLPTSRVVSSAAHGAELAVCRDDLGLGGAVELEDPCSPELFRAGDWLDWVGLSGQQQRFEARKSLARPHSFAGADGAQAGQVGRGEQDGVCREAAHHPELARRVQVECVERLEPAGAHALDHDLAHP
jgi:hypothetical protein